MNSKSEFNRCHIPRLVVEMEDEESKLRRLEREQLEDEELRGVLFWGVTFCGYLRGAAPAE